MVFLPPILKNMRVRQILSFPPILGVQLKKPYFKPPTSEICIYIYNPNVIAQKTG